ncbi:MAG: hypothetical protein H0T79_19890 [Deltaproteobacteria bacterium]|nr:hypothetical protein [Deltaproteobacteria bacterium]
MRPTRVIPAATLVTVLALAAPALAAPTERRVFSSDVDASSAMLTEWKTFAETAHPNYVADDDPKTAWIEAAPTSGAGEWIRVKVAPLDKTTKIKLKIRNGNQKSKDAFAANPRVKEMTVRLLPANVDKKVQLEDKDGWQEVTLEQPSGPFKGVELRIASVFEAAKSKDLAISDLQVFATSELADNPAFEKERQKALATWRASRLAASKAVAKKVSLPVYAAYEITTKDWAAPGKGFDKMLDAGDKDAIIGKEFKWALVHARKVLAEIDTLGRVQVGSKVPDLLPSVDGVQVPTLQDVSDGVFDDTAIRMPLLATFGAVLREHQKVTDVKDKLTFSEWSKQTGPCKAGDVAWAQRGDAADGVSAPVVRALVLGRCGKVATRDGSNVVREREIYVYDPEGRLAIVVAESHIEGYTWGLDRGKSMIQGGRSLLLQGKAVTAKLYEAY